MRVTLLRSDGLAPLPCSTHVPPYPVHWCRAGVPPEDPGHPAALPALLEEVQPRPGKGGALIAWGLQVLVPGVSCWWSNQSALPVQAATQTRATVQLDRETTAQNVAQAGIQADVSIQDMSRVRRVGCIAAPCVRAPA